MATSTNFGDLSPLDDFNSTRELVSVVRDALIIHRDLYCVKGTLHHSITPWNIRIDKNGRGILVDTDLRTWRKPLLRRKLQICRFSVGTPGLPTLGPRPDSSLAEDLESFFWVLLWMALQKCTTETAMETSTELWKWKDAYNSNEPGSAFHKLGQLAALSRSSDSFENMFQCQPLTYLLREIQRTLKGHHLDLFGYLILEEKKLQSHDHFIALFDETLNRDDWYNGVRNDCIKNGYRLAQA